MKAPDKIYLHGYSFDDEPCKSWEREPKVKGMRGYPALHEEYIRKDALLEWAKKRLKETSEAIETCKDDKWHLLLCGREDELKTFINQLNSL